jgi:hypothetical protein
VERGIKLILILTSSRDMTAIGSSVVQLLDGCCGDDFSTPLSAAAAALYTRQHDATVAETTEDSTSILQQTLNNNRPRVLVCGPSNCGRSSLLFQLAYTLQASNPAFYVLYICGTTNNSDKFALECTRIKDVERTTTPISAGHQQQEQQDSLSSYASTVLAKMQVHHVVSARDVYRILLPYTSDTAADLHGNKKQLAAIILDDVDRIVARDTDVDAVQHAMRISQLCTCPMLVRN